MSLKVLLLINFIIFYGIEKISGVCEIQFPTEYSKRPTTAKMIGSRLVNIPNRLLSSIHFQDGEVIRLHCNTTFISPTSYTGDSTIDINCHNGRLSPDYSMNTLLVECDSTTWNMYESSAPFTWCPLPKASYVIAKPNCRNDFLFLTSICYSFEDMSVQSLHYYMTPKSSQYSHQKLMREYKPETKISYIEENFISRRITPSMYDNPQIKHWMEFAKYESHSLIQESVIYSYHNSDIQLGGLLDIIWWSGLRLGSWQLYEEALRQHIETEDIEYDIIAGISGAVAAPIYKNEECFLCI